MVLVVVLKLSVIRNLYWFLSGPKHSAYTSLILPAGDGNLRQSMEMSNRPVIEDDEQVVYMNTREAQKQDNPKVSQILAN